jgi:hypothetical protein
VGPDRPPEDGFSLSAGLPSLIDQLTPGNQPGGGGQGPLTVAIALFPFKYRGALGQECGHRLLMILRGMRDGLHSG